MQTDKLPRVTISDIKARCSGHFFDRATMRMFNDTMANFRVTPDHENKVYLITRKRETQPGNKNAQWAYDPATRGISFSGVS